MVKILRNNVADSSSTHSQAPVQPGPRLVQSRECPSVCQKHVNVLQATVTVTFPILDGEVQAADQVKWISVHSWMEPVHQATSSKSLIKMSYLYKFLIKLWIIMKVFLPEIFFLKKRTVWTNPCKMRTHLLGKLGWLFLLSKHHRNVDMSQFHSKYWNTEKNLIAVSNSAFSASTTCSHWF